MHDKHEHLEFNTNLDEVQAAVQGSGPFEQMLLPRKQATPQVIYSHIIQCLQKLLMLTRNIKIVQLQLLCPTGHLK